MMNRFQNFAKEDYYRYTGANSLKNGSKPLICKMDDVEVIISGSEANTSFTEVQFSMLSNLDNPTVYGRIYGATCPVDYILMELELILSLKDNQILSLEDFGFEKLM